MMNHMKIDYQKKTIIVSKAFYKKAQRAGSAEYQMMMDAVAKVPDFNIDFKTSNKQTYRNLSYENMEGYIKSTDREDMEQLLVEFGRVKEQSKIQPGQYAYVKKWFLSVFPSYTQFDGALTAPQQEESKTVFFPVTSSQSL